MYPFDEKNDLPGVWGYVVGDTWEIDAEREKILHKVRIGKRLPYRVRGWGGHPKRLTSPFYVGSYLKYLSEVIFSNQVATLRGNDGGEYES